MKKRAYRTHLLAELRELNTTLRRIAATAEVDSKRGLAADGLVGVEIDGKVYVERYGDCTQ